LKQADVAELSDMKQSRISAMERPGTRWNIETLVRLVAAFKFGLVVKIVPFSEMLDWENEFNQDTFDPATIEEDAEFIGTEPRAADSSNSFAITGYMGQTSNVSASILNNYVSEVAIAPAPPIKATNGEATQNQSAAVGG